jgi:ABC-type amino acid transport substrate-binding protein
MLTLEAGTLKVASAFPDPPFELGTSEAPAGFDVELMRAVCRERKLELQLIRYAGDDFNGIFAGLAEGRYDAVISGTTITPERSKIVQFSQPYLEFNQGVAVNHQRTPHVETVADLRGLTAGIQSGNTSDIVARARGEADASGDSLLPVQWDRRGAPRSCRRPDRLRDQALSGHLTAGA